MPYFALIIIFYHVKIACYQVSTTRRPDNGDDGRLGRRGYCVGRGRGGAPGMTTVASDGGSGEKRLWL